MLKMWDKWVKISKIIEHLFTLHNKHLKKGVKLWRRNAVGRVDFRVSDMLYLSHNEREQNHRPEYSRVGDLFHLKQFNKHLLRSGLPFGRPALFVCRKMKRGDDCEQKGRG